MHHWGLRSSPGFQLHLTKKQAHWDSVNYMWMRVFMCLQLKPSKSSLRSVHTCHNSFFFSSPNCQQSFFMIAAEKLQILISRASPTQPPPPTPPVGASGRFVLARSRWPLPRRCVCGELTGTLLSVRRQGFGAAKKLGFPLISSSRVYNSTTAGCRGAAVNDLQMPHVNEPTREQRWVTVAREVTPSATGNPSPPGGRQIYC